MNEGITLEEILDVLPQAILFIGFVFLGGILAWWNTGLVEYWLGGILGKREIEIIDKKVEHVNHISIGLVKLFGRFAIDGNGQIVFTGEEDSKEGGQGFLQIAKGNLCQCSGQGSGVFGLVFCSLFTWCSRERPSEGLCQCFVEIIDKR